MRQLCIILYKLSLLCKMNKRVGQVHNHLYDYSLSKLSDCIIIAEMSGTDAGENLCAVDIIDCKEF